MKKLILLALFAVPAVFSLKANIKVGQDEIIVQIQNLSSEQNLQILSLFRSDSKVKVINTCSVLGIIVFDSLDKDNFSKLEVEAYVKFKIQKVFSDKSVVVQQEISKGQVNTLCREKVADLNNSN